MTFAEIQAQLVALRKQVQKLYTPIRVAKVLPFRRPVRGV